MLIDISISGERNVITKVAQKILKYKNLTIDIQSMWNVKSKVTPVIIRETGTVSKSFRKYLSNILGKQEIKELQKTVSHIGLCMHTGSINVNNNNNNNNKEEEGRRRRQEQQQQQQQHS